MAADDVLAVVAESLGTLAFAWFAATLCGVLAIVAVLWHFGVDVERDVDTVRGALEYGISLVRERAAGHGIDVALDIDPDIDTIDSDELRCNIIFCNSSCPEINTS